MSEEVTVIEIVRGDQASGARRAGLTQAQKTGQACLVCQGRDNLSREVGWVNGVRVRVHSYHLINYQLGETLPPPDA